MKNKKAYLIGLYPGPARVDQVVGADSGSKTDPTRAKKAHRDHEFTSCLAIIHRTIHGICTATYMNTYGYVWTSWEGEGDRPNTSESKR